MSHQSSKRHASLSLPCGIPPTKRTKEAVEPSAKPTPPGESQRVAESVPRANIKAPKSRSRSSTSIQVFLPSLSGCRRNFDWNATPWINRGVITPDDEQRHRVMKRAVGYFPQTTHEMVHPAVMNFGSLFSEHPPEVADTDWIYVVFPHIEAGSIGVTKSCAKVKKWTDEVVLPAMRNNSSAFDLLGVPPSHEFIVEESEGMPDRTFSFDPFYSALRGIWDVIVRTTEESGFEEFRDVFLVLVNKYHLEPAARKDKEKALAAIMDDLNEKIDLQRVSSKRIDIRAEDGVVL